MSSRWKQFHQSEKLKYACVGAVDAFEWYIDNVCLAQYMMKKNTGAYQPAVELQRRLFLVYNELSQSESVTRKYRGSVVFRWPK
jgi:hypothetical protein